MPNNPTILVAEDDPTDVFFLKRAIRRAEISDTIQMVSDGQEAIDYLQGVENYADRNTFGLPWMVFLDIKMPRKTGLETLQWMRGQQKWMDIPVLVLTSSTHGKDMEQATQLKANAYVPKPADIDVMAAELKKFYLFWRPTARSRSGQ